MGKHGQAWASMAFGLLRHVELEGITCRNILADVLCIYLAHNAHISCNDRGDAWDFIPGTEIGRLVSCHGALVFVSDLNGLEGISQNPIFM